MTINTGISGGFVKSLIVQNKKITWHVTITASKKNLHFIKSEILNTFTINFFKLLIKCVEVYLLLFYVIFLHYYVEPSCFNSNNKLPRQNHDMN